MTTSNSLPDTWLVSALGELGRWVGGGTPSKANQSYWSGSIPWVSPKDMKSEEIVDTEDHISERAVRESATNLVHDGAVLVVTRSGILRRTLPVSLSRRRLAINQDLKALEPSPWVNARFVAHFLRASEALILHECSKDGTTVQSIDSQKLLRFAIPIPPVAEQQRIVAAIEEHLTKLDAAVTSLARARANVRRYRASLLEATRSPATAIALLSSARIENDSGTPAWTIDRIGDIGAVVTGKTPPTANSENYGGKIPFMKPTDLAQGRFLHEAREHLTEKGVNFVRVLPPMSVLVTCIGATLGKTALARVQCTTNQQINSVIPNPKKVVPEFLYFSLTSPSGQRDLWDSSAATTLPILNKSRFQSIKLRVPPLTYQQALVSEIERRLSHADRLEAQITAAVQRAANLRRSVLTSAFDGNLVTQNPNDEPAAVMVQRLRLAASGNGEPRPRKKAARKRAR